MKTYKNYDFTEPKVHLDTGVIHAKLRGTWESIDSKNGLYHAPYEMLLWFSAPTEQDISCMVNVSSIVLKNLETEEALLISENSETTFRERSDGVHTASFNYKNLNIQHNDHELTFSYFFSKDCEFDQTSTPVSMIFKKQFSERNISFWDTLMGI